MRNLPYHVYIGHAQLRLPLNTLTIFSIYFLYFFFHFTHCSLLLLARRRVRAIYVLFAFVFFPFFLGCWMERSSNKIGSDFVVAGEFIIETYIQRVEAAAASYEFHSFINARVICATKFVVRCGVPRCCWCCCDARGPTYHSYTSIGIAVEYSLEYRWNYLHFFLLPRSCLAIMQSFFSSDYEMSVWRRCCVWNARQYLSSLRTSYSVTYHCITVARGGNWMAPPSKCVSYPSIAE